MVRVQYPGYSYHGFQQSIVIGGVSEDDEGSGGVAELLEFCRPQVHALNSYYEHEQTRSGMEAGRGARGVFREIYSADPK